MVALVLACLTLITLDAAAARTPRVEPAAQRRRRRSSGRSSRPAPTRGPAVHRRRRTGSATSDALRHDDRRPPSRRTPGCAAQLADHRLRPQPARRVRRPDLGRRRRSATRWCRPAWWPWARRSPSPAPSPSTPAPRAGVRPDMTVLNDDGLVGRVAAVPPDHRHRAADRRHRVGRRRPGRRDAWRSASCAAAAASATTARARPRAGRPDRSTAEGRRPVVTWGSEGGAPYVAGVPIGRVTVGLRQPARARQRAVIEPFVDFGALDLVGVVVPAGTARRPRRASRPRERSSERPLRGAVARRARPGRPLVLQVVGVPARRRGRGRARPRPARGGRRRAGPRPAVRRLARLRRRPAARPRAAGRPRRRPLGAGPGRRRATWPGGCARTRVPPRVTAVAGRRAPRRSSGTSVYALCRRRARRRRPAGRRAARGSSSSRRCGTSCSRRSRAAAGDVDVRAARPGADAPCDAGASSDGACDPAARRTGAGCG